MSPSRCRICSVEILSGTFFLQPAQVSSFIELAISGVPSSMLRRAHLPRADVFHRSGTRIRGLRNAVETLARAPQGRV
jgi:hypothetical protein